MQWNCILSKFVVLNALTEFGQIDVLKRADRKANLLGRDRVSAIEC